MDNNNVKSAKTLLVRDLEFHPIVLHDPISDALIENNTEFLI